MRRCVVYVTPELIGESLKHGWSAARVVENAIPADADLLFSNYDSDRRAFVLTFAHDSFQEGVSERVLYFEKQRET